METTETQETENVMISTEALNAIHNRITSGDERMSRMEDALAENTESTKRIESASADLLDFFDAAKGAFKVLNFIGSLARPIGYIMAAVAAVIAGWAALKGGTIGPK